MKGIFLYHQDCDVKEAAIIFASEKHLVLSQMLSLVPSDLR